MRASFTLDLGEWFGDDILTIYATYNLPHSVFRGVVLHEMYHAIQYGWLTVQGLNWYQRQKYQSLNQKDWEGMAYRFEERYLHQEQ